MVSVLHAFKGFPCFDGRRRPILVSGHALCKLIHIQPGAPGNDPVLRWVVERAECEALKSFGSRKANLEDLQRWLSGTQGRQIERELAKSHAAEVAAEEVEAKAEEGAELEPAAEA